MLAPGALLLLAGRWRPAGPLEAGSWGEAASGSAARR